MSNYQFATPVQVGEADNILAQSVRVTLDSVPELARVFVRLFPVAGLAYDVELSGPGTYDFLSVSGARVFVDPQYNSSYQAGTIAGSVRAYTALLVEVKSAVFNDTVTVVPNAALPLDYVGTVGNDVLVGDGGDNRMIGREGDDRISGGAGADRIDGGAGNDIADYSQSSATVSVTIGGAVSGGDAAGDTLISIEGVAGSAFGDTLTGDGSANTLDGGGGDDTLAGGGGDDMLAGGSGSDSLDGGAGNDTLDGGTGADTMAGGTGDDSYYVDNPGDRIVEAVNAGNDRVYASVGYVLTAGAEVETLSTNDAAGTAAINLTGNAFAQTIIGNAGANVLAGGGGTDTMIGLGGDDLYFVDGDDIVIEAVGGGTDRILASASYALQAGSEIERLTTDNNSGTAAIDLTGNAFSQGIYGNDGANTLRGGGGADDLVGLGGDDRIYVDGDDTVYEAIGGGFDRVLASESHALKAGAEVELLTTDNNFGTAAINLTGNEFAQALYGNDGANVLDGKGGSDDLIGFGGADVFAFTTRLGPDNVDTIYGFVSGSDRIAIDDAVFAGLTPGALPAGAFVTGTAALDADDRIIFDAATGRLRFDADGNGAGAAVQFATLTNGATVAATDFVVI